MSRWLLKRNRVDTERMAEALGLSPVMAQVLANRGVGSRAAAEVFLAAPLSSVRDPAGMKDFSRAVELVSEALEAGAAITVFGDYDVDGVCSTAILCKTLRDLGGQVEAYVPNRFEEGYGLTTDAATRLAEKGVKLLLTCDNGIAAQEAIARAKALGLTVVVLDHHEGTAPPSADACVDPKQPDCPYPFKMLCAGGLSYLFARALYQKRETACPRKRELLALAALATICDMVDLTAENRALAKQGLAVMDRTENLGLDALLEATGLKGQPITARTAGFVLGPCINAAGRLASAQEAVELLLTGDAERARTLAAALVALNEERKRQTQEAVERVLAEIDPSGKKVLVHYDPQVPEGVVGLAAGRVKEQFYRPTLLLTRAMDGTAKGSGRSVEGYHLYQSLLEQQELLVRFGGHALAAGLTLPVENLPALEEALNAACLLTPEELTPLYRGECVVRPEQLDLCLVRELSALAPFGRGNEQPMFALMGQRLARAQLLGAKQNALKLYLQSPDGFSFQTISFSGVNLLTEALKPLQADKICEKIATGAVLGFTVDLLVQVEANQYRGRDCVQLRLVDLRLSEMKGS